MIQDTIKNLLSMFWRVVGPREVKERQKAQGSGQRGFRK
jgi:hypothetical protein